MRIPRLIITGPSSGVGKTSITCAIIHGIKNQGYTSQPFKVGPDYIDPTFLTKISGNDTRNLDVWLMGKNQLYKTFVLHSRSDISIIEGVMGYYDGFSGKSSYASTYHVSNILKSPVILVLDASKAARSVAATALGFRKFHKNSRIEGLILNNIGSKKHETLCKQALEPFRIPILGYIPKNLNFSLSSRHLGLIPTIASKTQEKAIQKISKEIADFLDIEKIIQISKKGPSFKKIIGKPIKKPITSVAVALDSSFNFYYHDNLESLRREGVELKFFSPISDSKIPRCHGLYLGGGFPEVMAKPLHKNKKMRKIIKEMAEDNTPIYAECGGLMYLTKSIHDGTKKLKMVGLFDAETRMTRKMKLNYTKGKITTNCLISSRAKNFQGHEFHYSELYAIPNDSNFVYNLSIGEGIKGKKDGLCVNNTLASYSHLYFDSGNFSKIFAKKCLEFSKT